MHGLLYFILILFLYVVNQHVIFYLCPRHSKELFRLYLTYVTLLYIFYLEWGRKRLFKRRPQLYPVHCKATSRRLLACIDKHEIRLKRIEQIEGQKERKKSWRRESHISSGPSFRSSGEVRYNRYTDTHTVYKKRVRSSF